MQNESVARNEFESPNAQNHVPVDFVSSHGYTDDTVQNLFHSNEDIAMDNRVCRAIEKVQGQIKTSSTPGLPLFWTEWNVQGMDESRDTTFVGPAVANTVRQCDGHVTMMSFWTFSDVFEEGGPIPKPFEGPPHYHRRSKPTSPRESWSFYSNQMP